MGATGFRGSGLKPCTVHSGLPRGQPCRPQEWWAGQGAQPLPTLQSPHRQHPGGPDKAVGLPAAPAGAQGPPVETLRWVHIFQPREG